MLRFFSFCWLLVINLFVVGSDADCKCTPGSPCWPSDSDWTAFNTTLSGALVRGVPPGSVCYSDQPNYDGTLCATALSRWTDSTWHAQSPISIDYPIWVNNSCNPIYPNGTSVDGDVSAGARGCTIGNYPVYAVAATTSQHVSRAFKWAAKKNIRVVIKNTGHNYPGRNTGYGSLSIWTHNLRGIEYINNFKPTSCPYNAALTGIRVAAGEVGSDIQAVADSHGVAVVGGGNPDTGLHGWFTGGGHGWLSTDYGMGADNLLEATIVRPDGKFVTANPCQNSDLFFAIRGGGGGTFGVVMSAVVRAFPTPQTTRHQFNITGIAPNSAATEFWDLMGFIHSELPKLSAGGMQGYYEPVVVTTTPTGPTLLFFWHMLLYDKPEGTAEALMKPITDYLDNLSALYTYQQESRPFPTYKSAFDSFEGNEPVGSSVGAYGSHFLTKASLADPKLISEAFIKAAPPLDAANPVLNPFILGHLIASPNPPSYYPEVESMTPAWRDTTTHFIYGEYWPVGADRATIDATYEDISQNRVGPFRELSPDPGAYFNECDSLEPDWQASFWGPNYPRLLAIKQKYDPNTLLWCDRCVGSEAWEEADGGGALCRT